MRGGRDHKMKDGCSQSIERWLGLKGAGGCSEGCQQLVAWFDASRADAEITAEAAPCPPHTATPTVQHKPSGFLGSLGISIQGFPRMT